jgi:hypothetical protein
MSELKTGSQNAPDIHNFTFEAFEIDDPEILIGQDVKVNNIQFGSADDDCLKGKDTQGNSAHILIRLGGQDVLVGANGRDRFVLGRTDEVGDVEVNLPGKDGEKVLGDRAGDDDYALIEKFDTKQDFIELIGSKNDYPLEASPIDLAEGTDIFQGDELVGIVEGTNKLDHKLDLDASYFEFSL